MMQADFPTRRRGRVLVPALVVVLGSGLLAQTPAAPAQPPVVAQPPSQPEGYHYDPDGRRDPFVGLLGGGVQSRSPGAHGGGLAGLSASDLSVRGIVQSRSGFVAMIQGPDSRTYIVHANDRLLDGTVTSITAQDLIITQEVNDPLSLVKQREVRKSLRPLEEGK